jgi:hypothetical protein
MAATTIAAFGRRPYHAQIAAAVTAVAGTPIVHIAQGGKGHGIRSRTLPEKTIQTARSSADAQPARKGAAGI